MSETKWIAFDDDAEGDGMWHITTQDRLDAGKVEIASIDVSFNGQVGAENRAAVPLMAAAPDMAAAIQLLIDSLEGRDVHPEEAIGACRAALAKARGKA